MSKNTPPKNTLPKQSLLDEVLDELKGEDGAQLLGSQDLSIKIKGVIPTGCPSVDAAIGRGGVPLGRLSIVSGKEGCLAGDTMVGINRAKATHAYRIDHVVKMLNGGSASGKIWDKNISTYIRARVEDGTVGLIRLKDAWQAGEKEVWELDTCLGRKIRATAEHKFFTVDGWKRLGELVVGERLHIQASNKPMKKSVGAKKIYATKTLAHHPFAAGRNVERYAVPIHRLMVEADMNGISFDVFVSRVLRNDLDNLVFLDPKTHVVHHKDFNHRNNDLDNLVAVSPEKHRQLHGEQCAVNFADQTIETELVSIKKIGVEKVYDIETESPHNYIANDFVVHNSGKTTLALHTVAECQAMGGIAVYMDMEYKMDPDYAAKLGVDVANLVIIQPPHLEKIFMAKQRIIKRATAHRKKTKKDVPILIVMDSMNAAITKSQFEGEFDDQPHYGPQARVYSQLLPKFIPSVSKSQTALLWISQVRKNIGVTFGSDETLCGGSAPRFYASLIMNVTRMSATKNTDGDKVSNLIRVDCNKNQIAPPFKKAECEIVYGKGVDKELSLIWIAEKRGLLKKEKTTYMFRKKKLGVGKKNAAKFLRKNAGTKERLTMALRKDCGWDVE
jgi:recombination protein RecA